MFHKEKLFERNYTRGRIFRQACTNKAVGDFSFNTFLINSIINYSFVMNNNKKCYEFRRCCDEVFCFQLFLGFNILTAFSIL